MTLPVQRASMIRDAMVHLKQRKGASLALIRKHLESNYAEKLDAATQKLLSTTLKGLVQKGKIHKTGKVYEIRKAGAKVVRTMTMRLALPVGDEDSPMGGARHIEGTIRRALHIGGDGGK